MNLSDWVDRRADFTPDKTAIRFAGDQTSYAAFAECVALLAGAMRAGLGVDRGDRLAFLGFNCPQLLALVFASARVGAILVPVNWRLAAAEVRFVIEHARPGVVVVGSEFVETVEALRPDLGDLHLVALDTAPAGWVSLAELLDDARPQGGRDSDVGYDARVLLCYTSGTTGQPKGAVLDQNALLFNAINSVHLHDMTSEDRVLTTLPLFHVGGLNIQTLPALHAGATLSLHPKFDPEQTLDALEAEETTLTVLVPAQLDALMASPRWDTVDLSALRMITTGSTLVPRALIDAVHARGIPLVQVYGATETAPIATYLMTNDCERKAGSAGKAATHCDVRVADDRDHDVAPGERGEVLVSGPAVMTGYWDDPRATEEALRGGWFHSGDIGHLDGEGFLYIDDRKKDVIISGGENIYPAELENVLAECPEVAEAAVVGRPDARWGEVPVVVAVREAGSRLDADAVRALFDGRIARYKHPRDVIFVDFLPRNVMGKIRKDALREQVSDPTTPPKVDQTDQTILADQAGEESADE